VKVDEHELESWRRLGRKGWISCAFMFYIWIIIWCFIFLLITYLSFDP
jgi:uncharacterized membrane protein